MVLLKVIVDLMEAYSDHIGLPLLLVNLEGKIDYKICGDENLFSCHDPTFLLSKLKNISLKQNKPTIISILEESIQASLFYIITPIFKFRNSQFFVVAGPCLLETENIENSNQFHLNIYNDDEIEDKLCKIRNLYSLLANKDMIETKLVLPEEIINILQKVGSFDCEKIDNDFYIFNCLDEFLNVSGIDFIGIAKKMKRIYM